MMFDWKEPLRRLKHARWIDERRFYELWERTHLRKLLSALHVDCVFDVGANQGQYAKMLRRSAGYRGLIISFEAIPEAAGEVERLARGDPLWRVEEVALSDIGGEQVFNVMADAQFSSLSAPRHNEVQGFERRNRVQRQVHVRTETIVAALARLQQTLGFPRPFLKLDTQGMDVRIVSAAGRSGLQPFVGLQSELAVRKLYDTSVDYREALRIYEELGFELSAFVPNNAGHFPRLVEIDCILVRADLMPARVT